ncbi:MAG: FixH family protein [Pseudomonadota bacterium]
MTRSSPSDASPQGGRPLTGRKVLIIALCAFGVVIAANATMATFAISGFPGLVTKNPYVDGQHFQAENAAERALGWQVSAEWDAAAQRLAVHVVDAAGRPARGLQVSALVGRPATDAEDRAVAFAPRGDGAYDAPAALGQGAWRVEVTAVRPADGARYVIADKIRVPAKP